MPNDNHPETLLVTGGAGFIGSHVARHLLDRGCRVVVLDDLSGGYEDNVPQGSIFVQGSVLDKRCLDEMFSSYSFDSVFHLAAYAAEGLSHFARAFNYSNNVVGSMELISRAVHAGCRRFVFTSSIAVYGAVAPPMKEDTSPRPEDPYGIAKWAVEQDLEAARHMFGLEYTIFRPHNVYGEGQNIGDPFRNVIGIFMKQILDDCPLTVFGDGQQTRAFSHIDQVAPVIARSPWVEGAANETFNIGADQPYTINELAAAVGEAMRTQVRIEHLPERLEVRDAYAIHDKVRSIFGDEPVINLKEGLSRMAAWVRQTGVRTSPRLPDIEIWNNMPAHWRGVYEIDCSSSSS